MLYRQADQVSTVGVWHLLSILLKYVLLTYLLNVQLDDLMVALESERAKSAALDKKQRKFDQSLAEEKAVSER